VHLKPQRMDARKQTAEQGRSDRHSVAVPVPVTVPVPGVFGGASKMEWEMESEWSRNGVGVGCWLSSASGFAVALG
jgi:hypothetical protein